MSARKAFFDHHRWWIFKDVWSGAWYCSSPGYTTADSARFKTHKEAVAYFAANVRPIGAGE